MNEIIGRIMSEIEDSLVIPSISDHDMKQVIGFVLTIAFSIMREEAEKIG
ncbi:MAG: hypothetical protein WCX83_03665 [Candidatus Cloacimonas sp.]